MGSNEAEEEDLGRTLLTLRGGKVRVLPRLTKGLEAGYGDNPS